jgi:hypothetical protein
MMNDFAAKHNGIAPVVVMPDGTGGQLTNSLCTDSSLGKLDTYLSKDVPNSIRAQLRVDPDPKALGDRRIFLRRYVRDSTGDKPS